jgi:hypothetical protein
MTDPGKPHLVEVSKGDPGDIFNDLTELRKSTAKPVTKREVSADVPVGKPSPTGYFRVHPNPEMSLVASIFKYEEGCERANLFVYPSMRGHPLLKDRLRLVLLSLIYNWPSRELSIWPAPLDINTHTNRWHTTANTAWHLAKTNWVQMSAAGDHYSVHIAEGELPQPEWGDRSLTDLLKIAFKAHIINDEDCPFMRKLRGIE